MGREVIIAYFWEVVFKMQVLLFFIFWGCVGILYLVIRRISRPLGQLTEYARKVAAHDFSDSIDIRTRDELEVLGRAMMSMGQELALLFSEMESEVDKATADLREHMAYLSAIIDNLADGLLVVGVKGEITVLNPAMRELFGLEEKGYEGSLVQQVFPTEVGELTKAICGCEGKVVSGEIGLSRGRTGKAVGSSIYVSEPAPQCMGGVLLVRDITREKELDQLKTDFISTVSHELRTPMTSVLGFSKIIRKKLEKSVFPPLAGRADVEKAHRAGAEQHGDHRGRGRTADRADQRRPGHRQDGGREIQWRDEEVSMGAVLEQSREATRGLWQSKGLEVVTQVAGGLPRINGDRARLVQVVVNLISNAVKFTGVGPVVCSARQEGDDILVSVRDNGEGIEPGDMHLIFDKFKQVGDTLTSKPEGTGLGLPICRQIVERHNGRIWVESEPGKGSVFSFTIPVSGSAKTGEAKDVSCRQPEMRPGDTAGDRTNARPLVLVVDDDPSLIEYLSQVFEDQGFIVCEAMSGPEAIRTAQSVLPDLITMDIMMPGMDGREVIERLRRIPATRSIPILVITALSGVEEEAGDMALVKPVDDVTLLEAARALLDGKECCDSCIVLGDGRSCDLNGLAVLCTGDVRFTSVEAFWKLAEEGVPGDGVHPGGGMRQCGVEEAFRAAGDLGDHPAAVGLRVRRALFQLRYHAHLWHDIQIGGTVPAGFFLTVCFQGVAKWP